MQLSNLKLKTESATVGIEQGDTSMNVLLIVDDDVKDLRFAVDVARSVGFGDIEGRTSFYEAMKYLEAALLDKCHFPDAMIIDLNLGQDSGYELLRYCCTTPRLASVPVIVWSILGEHQRELCSVFRVRGYIEKWDKEDALRDALKELRESTPPEAIDGATVHNS